jgi:two-component system nitrogen regulation response regulator NtrX
VKALHAVRGPDQGTEARPAFLYVPTAGRARSPVLDRLARLGVPFAAATDPAHASRMLTGRPIGLAMVDLAGDRVALSAIRAIRAGHPHILIAAIVDPANPLMSGEAVHAGAFDLVPWPFEDRDVLTILANARELAVAEPRSSDGQSERLVAQSAAMREVVERVRAAANGRSGLLICGEPGTGRSVVAREVHETWRAKQAGQAGPGGRMVPKGAWVIADCAEGTPDEIERRIFGVSGEPRRNGGPRAAAFERIGRDSALHGARGGTLYLRNLVDAPARIQARLARLLRDQEAELADQPGTLVQLDIRVVASVEPGVDEAAKDGRMRPDLLERLGQTRIDVPVLVRRREDIPVLAVLFLQRACDRARVAQKGISRSALKLLSALPWHGQAAELRTLVDTIVGAVARPVLQLDDVLEHATFESAGVRIEAGVTLREARARFERECIGAVLARHQGRVGDAARALGIQRTNLYRKVRQLQMPRLKAVRRPAR